MLHTIHVLCFLVNNCKFIKTFHFILQYLGENCCVMRDIHRVWRHLLRGQHVLISDWEVFSLLWKSTFIEYDWSYSDLLEVLFSYVRHGFISKQNVVSPYYTSKRKDLKVKRNTQLINTLFSTRDLKY